MKFSIEIRDLPTHQRAFIFKNVVINITHTTNTPNIFISFNLEKIKKKEAKRIIKEFKEVIDFEETELKDHPLDYDVVCKCNTEDRRTILKAITEYFKIDSFTVV